MKNLFVTCYERFSHCLGNFLLFKLLIGIKEGRWEKPIEALRQAIARGDKAEADRIKKSLPAFTLSACYADARRNNGLTRYNGLIILDIDKLDADQIDPIVWRASDSPYTIFAFRSPGGRGVKIGVDPLAENALPLIDHPLRLENHRATFEACRKHYESLLDITVDPSGKDPGRLCFVSYDPDAYMAIDKLLKPRPATEPQQEAGEVTQNSQEQCPLSANDAEKESRDIFRVIRKKTTRKIKYTEGNRNNYLFLFATYCCQENISQDETLAYCRVKFSDLQETELYATVKSAYHSGSESKNEDKKKNIICRIREELNKRFTFRYNRIMNSLEFRRRKSKSPFQAMDKKMENTLWCELIDKGIQCQQKMLQAVLMSDFVPDYHPFCDYFDNLPPWDGVTDHIREVADTVQTTNQEWWYECFRRWIVALVACATRPGVENHTVLMLDGEQGTGKTRWCCNLVPPELHAYRHSGPANPRSKDIRIGMSQCLIINLDELQALDEHELNQMKEMITTSVIRERRPYGEHAEQYNRVCSFTASIDSSLVLTDINGSRRFLGFHVRSIDYTSPINYAGLYSQAVALLNNGFKYWFDRSDIEILNQNNEEFRIHSPEEEFLLTYYRKPQEGDTNISYITAAQILHYLCLKSYLKVTQKSTNLLSMILKRNGFKQVRRQNRRLFAVVLRTDEEVKAEKEGKNISSDKKDKNSDSQGTLPL